MIFRFLKKHLNTYAGDVNEGIKTSLSILLH